MRRPLLVLILCLLAGLLAWSGLRDGASRPSDEKTKATVPASATPVPRTVEMTAADAPPPMPAEVKPKLDDSKSGPRFKRAYMLSLDAGRLALVEQQDIEGDFSPKRRRPEEWSGMLRCRLMSEQGAVLAEELLPAPDHVCAVLDPISGTDKPVQFTAPSGPVIFQVRLPRVKDAVRLDISRIIQPADSAQPGLEGQLGSIPLPRS